MTSNKKIKKTPPNEMVNSVQGDLFSQFLTNDKNNSSLSNTIEVWENVPKYFFTRSQISKLRTKDGHADPFTWEYEHEGAQFSVEIQPALIKQPNGRWKAYFPSSTEELVEEALKRIFTKQNLGIHLAKDQESWVRFSLSLIKSELAAHNKDRDRNEIKHALEVMSKTSIRIFREGKEQYTGSLIQDLVTVNRKDYEESGCEALHAARFPVFISMAINNLKYRQFNYKSLMLCKLPLSRWIYKKLINRFTNANVENSYHFKFSTLQRDSGLLQQTKQRNNRDKVTAALTELIEIKVIDRYEATEKKKGNAVIEVVYKLYPTSKFVSEQKASNKRAKDNETKADMLSLSVDK